MRYKLKGRESEVIASYNGGKSSTEVALLFDVSHVSIVQCLKRMGIPRREKRMPLKLYCKNGHALSEGNLYLSPKGVRGCRQCRCSNDAKCRKTEFRKTYARNWMRKQRAENPKRLQNYHFTKDYGITIEERDAKLSQQNNCCMICNRSMENPCVDHNHKTGQVRDLLCRSCNCALGLFQDDILILESALAYLKKWKGQ